jgi:hypothetical protein
MSNKNIDYRNLIQNQFQPKESRKQTVLLFILMLVLFAGFYYFSTHYQNKPQYILPPKINTENQTFAEVMSFIRSDNTDKIRYEEGFNCWDYTFRVLLNARWKGIASVPIAIQYEEPPGHMVIAFPTTDRGDVFIEPQNDQQIRLRVGQVYDGRKIRGFYYIDIFHPVPLANSPEYDPSIQLK